VSFRTAEPALKDVLDGTAAGQPVPTRTEKGAEIRRLYFLDIAKCLDPNTDREGAVISVAEILQVTSDFCRNNIDADISTLELQYAHRLFLVALLFDIQRFIAWQSGFSSHHRPCSS
jgi:hypothetical protein